MVAILVKLDSSVFHELADARDALPREDFTLASAEDERGDGGVRARASPVLMRVVVHEFAQRLGIALERLALQRVQHPGFSLFGLFHRH